MKQQSRQHRVSFLKRVLLDVIGSAGDQLVKVGTVVCFVVPLLNVRTPDAYVACSAVIVAGFVLTGFHAYLKRRLAPDDSDNNS